MENPHKKLFWTWVGCTTPNEHLVVPNIELLDERFRCHNRKEQTWLSQAFFYYLDVADRIELWELCSLMSGQPCGDDSFAYFRRWLVLQGKSIFNAILDDPDAMAGLRGNDGLIPAEPFVESAGVIENARFRAPMDGPEMFLHCDWSWKDSSIDRIRADLPSTYGQIGHKFRWDSSSREQHTDVCDAPGLGVIRVGDRLRHKSGLGEGTVVSVLIPETSVVEIEFSFGKETMGVTADFFERIT